METGVHMDTFGAALFYGSGAVFAEYRSAWKQGQPDIHIMDDVVLGEK